VALAACDLLARIVAYSRPLGGLHALALQCSRRGGLVAPGLTANRSSKRVMKPLPCAIMAKRLNVRRHTLPTGSVLGQHAPLVSCDGQIPDRVHDRSHAERSRTAAWFGVWDEVFDPIPLSIPPVSWRDLVCFPLPSLSHLTDCLPPFQTGSQLDCVHFQRNNTRPA
jgi:hypothetical protein